MTDSAQHDELKISFKSIIRDAIELFRKSFPVFLKFFIFYSICTGIVDVIAINNSLTFGSMKLLFLMPLVKIILSIIGYMIMPLMIKHMILEKEPKIWVIIPSIGKSELMYWSYNLLIWLMCMIIPILIYIFCFIIFFIGKSAETDFIGVIFANIIIGILAFTVMTFIMIKYLLAPIFVPTEPTEARFSIITKASKKTLKSYRLAIFIIFIISLLIGVVFAGLIGFSGSFFKGVGTDNQNELMRILLLFSFLEHFVLSIFTLLNCAILSSIYLHFRERMITNVQLLQLEKTTILKE